MHFSIDRTVHTTAFDKPVVDGLFYMHHPTDRIAHTTAFVTLVVEHWLKLEIAQWFHPMKDRSDDPLHHGRTLLPRSYISLLEQNKRQNITFIHWVWELDVAPW